MSQFCGHDLPCNCLRDALEVLDKVENHINECIQVYMSLEETMKCLQITQQIDPQITKTVWEDLERKNPEFFKVYNLSVETFNRLLAPQAALMQEHDEVDLTNLPPAINEFLRQDPAGTRFLQNEVLVSAANTPIDRSKVSSSSLVLPDTNGLREDQLQIPDEQQPQHHNQLFIPHEFASTENDSKPALITSE